MTATQNEQQAPQEPQAPQPNTGLAWWAIPSVVLGVLAAYYVGDPTKQRYNKTAAELRAAIAACVGRTLPPAWVSETRISADERASPHHYQIVTDISTPPTFEPGTSEVSEARVTTPIGSHSDSAWDRLNNKAYLKTYRSGMWAETRRVRPITADQAVGLVRKSRNAHLLIEPCDLSPTAESSRLACYSTAILKQPERYGFSAVFHQNQPGHYTLVGTEHINEGYAAPRWPQVFVSLSFNGEGFVAAHRTEVTNLDPTKALINNASQDVAACHTSATATVMRAELAEQAKILAEREAARQRAQARAEAATAERERLRAQHQAALQCFGDIRRSTPNITGVRQHSMDPRALIVNFNFEGAPGGNGKQDIRGDAAINTGDRSITIIYDVITYTPTTPEEVWKKYRRDGANPQMCDNHHATRNTPDGQSLYLYCLREAFRVNGNTSQDGISFRIQQAANTPRSATLTDTRPRLLWESKAPDIVITFGDDGKPIFSEEHIKGHNTGDISKLPEPAGSVLDGMMATCLPPQAQAAQPQAAQKPQP